jgi:hypothetical protein
MVADDARQDGGVGLGGQRTLAVDSNPYRSYWESTPAANINRPVAVYRPQHPNLNAAATPVEGDSD